MNQSPKPPSFPIRSIRKDVLGVTQKQLAELVGVTQGTVSKWEDGTLFPNVREMSIIRDFARKNGKPWSDSWVFDNPVLQGDAA